MMRRWILWTLLLPLFCAGFGVCARAQADPCTFTVTKPYAFGANVDLMTDPTASQPYNQTVGDISITCNNIPKNDAGNAQRALVCIGIPNDLATTSRVMDWSAAPASGKGPSPTAVRKLSFGIFRDEARVTPWPNGLAELPTRDLGNGETAALLSFYGKINPFQNLASVGSYNGNFQVIFRVYVYAPPEPPPSCTLSDKPGGLRVYYRTTVDVPVTATIRNMCTFTAPPADMVFPGQTIIKSTDVIKAETTIKLTCSMDTPYWISLSDGDWKSGGSRRMKREGSDDFIRYQLYRTQDLSGLPWGVTQNVDTVSGAGNAANKDHGVYGKILPNNTSPRPGQYSDRIIVSVNF